MITKLTIGTLKSEIAQYGEAMAMGDRAAADRARVTILGILDDLLAESEQAEQIRAEGLDIYHVHDLVWYHPREGEPQPGFVTEVRSDTVEGAQSLYIRTDQHLMVGTNARSLTRRIRCTFANANGQCGESAAFGSPTASCEVHEL